MPQIKQGRINKSEVFRYHPLDFTGISKDLYNKFKTQKSPLYKGLSIKGFSMKAFLSS